MTRRRTTASRAARAMRPGRRRSLAATVVGAMTLQRVAELRLSRRNERAARTAGAVEFGAAHFRGFVLLHAAWLTGLLVEGRSPDGCRRADPRWLIGVGAAAAMRLATMRALGDQWTARVLIRPDRRRVTTGPYRWTRHPAYLAVTVEIAATPLALGARRTAVVASAANALLLGALRIPAETEAEGTRRPAHQGPGAASRRPIAMWRGRRRRQRGRRAVQAAAPLVVR